MMNNSFQEALQDLASSSKPYTIFSDPSITLENFQSKLPADYCAVPSHEGEVDEIHDEGNLSDFGKHSAAFSFHVDGGYYPYVPHYFVLYCVSASLSGGNTVFSDSKKVIDRLYQKYDQNFLDSMKIMYMSRGNSLYERFLIEVSHDGSNLKRLNWYSSAYFLPDLSKLSIQNRKNYTNLLGEFLKDIKKYLEEAIVLDHQWQAGQGIVADNRRLLHGRKAFQGGSRLLYRMMIDNVGFDLSQRPKNIPH